MDKGAEISNPSRLNRLSLCVMVRAHRYSLQGILLQSLQVASIIFLDAPVGTGFSYANNWESYVVDDHLSATDTYNFLIKVSIHFHQNFILTSLLSILVVNNVYFTSIWYHSCVI